MSGGVDSSAAAALLLDKGYEVEGATMQIWPDVTDEEERITRGCCSQSAVDDARRVAMHLGIKYHVFNFKDIFEKSVISPFVCEYLRGRTPNPCIECNKIVKFEAFLNRALTLGFDYIATGHYGSVIDNNGIYELHSSKAAKKDQSYFLYNFTQHTLKHTLMPLGGYCKEQVREIAKELEIPVANKPDSQEICFVCDDDYAGFICDYADYEPVSGDMLDVNGNVIGTHKGLIHYTIGQRKGIGAFGRPMFVMSLDAQNNAITLGEKGMEFSKELTAADMNYISGNPITEATRLKAKIRYQAEAADVTVYPGVNNTARIVFNTPQRAVTPGQAVVLYDGDNVVGGGTVM